MIRLVQCRCGRGHILLAIAYNSGKSLAPAEGGGLVALDESNATHYLRTAIDSDLGRDAGKQRCPICLSRDRVYSDDPTIYETLDDAQPWLQSIHRQLKRDHAHARAARN